MNVFISGSAGFKHPINMLPKAVETEIDKHIGNNDTILIGDCKGIDSLVQSYLKQKNYKNVIVYHTTAAPRNCTDNAWARKHIHSNETNRNFFAAKDNAMCDETDAGIAVWDGQSKGTACNIARLKNQNKPVMIFHMDTETWEKG